MDKTPIFSHFLRTIFFANFVFILLNPFSKIIDFIYVIAPAAILCGIYYDIAVRRYSQEIRRLAIFNALFLLFVAFCMLNFVLIPGEFLAKIIHIDYSEIRYLKENINHLYIIFFTSFIILTFGIWMFYYRKKRQIWFVLLTNIIAIAIFFWQIVYPLKSAKNERSNLGAELKRIISAENITNPQIFKSEILGLYSECYYLGYPVKKINSLNELPAEPETIYLLGIEFPQYPKRIWRNLLTQEYRGHTLYLWRGDLHKRKEFINRRIKQTETNANVKEK